MMNNLLTIFNLNISIIYSLIVIVQLT